MKKTISTATTTTVRTRNFKDKTRTTTTTTEVIVEEEPIAPTPIVEVKETVPPPPPAPPKFYEVLPERFGFAEKVTGGGLGTFEKVISRSELLDALKDPNVARVDIVSDINLGDAVPDTSSNKTVISSNGSILHNLRWRIRNRNILLMNLLLTESKDDLITLDYASDIYIKNCFFDSQYGLPFVKHPKTPSLGATEEEVKEALREWATMDRSSWQQNVIDGQIDMIGSKNVTIDSCRFASHDKVSLIRSGTTMVSILNSLYRNTFQRGPQATGLLHFANNVYQDVKYGMRSIEQGNFLAEGNMFINTEKINRTSTSSDNLFAYGRIRNSYMENCGSFDQPLAPPASLLWEPSDFYKFEVKTPNAELANKIMASAGNVLHRL